jgi:nitrate/nitrite-specific signal transduction histidine kinase
VVQQVLSREVGAVRTHALDGQEIVASFAPVPGTPWGLVTEESWAMLISPIQGYQRFLLLLLALGVIVTSFIVTLGVRRITQPITALIGAAQEVARGNFGQTITARTGDEIEELAEQFNLMSAQLQESYAHLEQRVAERTKELAALNAIAATVSQSLHLDEILDDALYKTLQALEIEAGGIYLLDEEAGVLSIAAQRGFSPQSVAEIDRLKLGEGFSGQVAQSGQPLVVKDASTDPRLTRTVVQEEGLRSLASVPLSSKGKVLGTLFAITRGYREFTDQDVQLLTSISNQIGVAIENARLFSAVQRRAEQFRVISEVGRHTTSILAVDELLDQLVGLIQKTLKYDTVEIGLIEGE